MTIQITKSEKADPEATLGPITSAVYGQQDMTAFFEKAIASISEPRQAKCYCCKRIVEVNETNRRQFIITPQPAAEVDSMYCGCRGWD